MQLRQSGGHYLYQQLACPLLQLSPSLNPEPLTAQCSYKSDLEIECTLLGSVFFENGIAVTAFDYLEAFKKFVNPEAPAFRADLLLSLKNSKKILQKKLPSHQLGVKAINNKSLLLTLEQPDPYFLLKLSNPLLSPYKEKPSTKDNRALPDSCGPYQIESWINQKKIKIIPHQFNQAKKKEPQVEFVIYSDDNLALKDFKRHQLQMLRRLPTSLIPQWINTKYYHQIDLLRFDSLFLQGPLKNYTLPLSQAINYTDWQKLYHAKPRPGCFGLPADWSGKAVCHEFAPTPAPLNFKKNSSDNPTPLALAYSRLGGVDHDRAMQFLQSEWKKHLGIQVSLEPLENKIFQEKVEKNEIYFYRKGLSLEYPHCISALELFSKTSQSPQIIWDEPEFEKIIKEFYSKKVSFAQSKDLCQRGLTILRDKGGLIPTGPLFFSILVSPHWRGWEINSLNHLNLKNLQYRAP